MREPVPAIVEQVPVVSVEDVPVVTAEEVPVVTAEEVPVATVEEVPEPTVEEVPAVPTREEVPVVEDIFVPTGTEPREESAVAEGSKERPETRGLLDLTTPENAVDFAL